MTTKIPLSVLIEIISMVSYRIPAVVLAEEIELSEDMQIKLGDLCRQYLNGIEKEWAMRELGRNDASDP